MMRRFRWRLAAAACMLLLAGCALTGLQEPPGLYTLTAASSFADGLPRVDRQLLIETPVAPAGLDTARIALRNAPTNLAYFANVSWTDRAPAMIQTLLTESFENSHRIVAVGRGGSALRADELLQVDLRDFQAEYQGAGDHGAPVARVDLSVRLVGLSRREIIASNRFSAAVPAQSAEFSAIIDAWNQAMHSVLQQVVGWTLQRAAAQAG